MLDFGFYNMDCMEGMKQFPDKYFDLAIVDPPYGDGRGGSGTGSENGSKGTSIHKLGNAGKWATASRLQMGGVELPERAEHGRRNSEKNCSVGHRAGKGILRRTFPCLTKSGHLGGQLLRTPGNEMLSDMAQNKRSGKVQHGHGRVRLDFIQRKRKSI